LTDGSTGSRRSATEKTSTDLSSATHEILDYYHSSAKTPSLRTYGSSWKQ
jgi:hypothetical protein